MDIVIDFDGTVVTHAFPQIGEDIGAVPVLKELVSNGHRLILFTMRSNTERPENYDPIFGPPSGPLLDDAVQWFADNDIPLFGIQRNPTQDSWTSSPKAYGSLIIDDAALGCPLKFDKTISSRPFVDWTAVKKILIQKGLLPPF